MLAPTQDSHHYARADRAGAPCKEREDEDEQLPHVPAAGITACLEGGGTIEKGCRGTGDERRRAFPMRQALKALGTTFVGAALLAIFALVPAYAQTVPQADWVRNYSSGYDPAFAFAYALAVDASGNVYVTGYSSNDYATIKYSPSGIQQWVARYNGPGNTADRAWALAVDGSGNVYVTGDSGEGSSNLSDYVTVKYDSAGVQQWAARYNNSYDYATDLAVDPAGSVYVTGYSYGFGTYYDYATIKYSAAGHQRWVARYHGGTGDDFAYDLAADASGNVYVTGETFGSGTGSEYGTVKYNAKGRQQWVARYNGPGNAYASDRANAVAIDASGNVYVTGESEGSDR